MKMAKKKNTPEYVPLLVLGMIFLQNMLEEGMATLKHEGAHCRSAESIRAACEPYYKSRFWNRFFYWLGWIIPIVSACVVVKVGLGFWFLAPIISAVICLILEYWFDPKKILQANPQMGEFIRIRHLWEPQRDFYLKSGYVDHLIPSFYKFSENEGTQLGFDCMVWVINGETHKLRSALKDIMTNAMLKVAHEFYVVECTGDAESITKARQKLVYLLGQLNQGSYRFISDWTVGGASKAAVKMYGEYDPSTGLIVKKEPS